MVHRSKRFVSVVIFAGLACVVGASLAWACTPSTFGTPATPAPPPPTTAVPSPVPPASPTGPTPQAAPPGAVNVNVNTLPAQSFSTTGQSPPLRTTGSEPNPGATRGPAGTPAVAVDVGRSRAGSAFGQRAAGGTAGTVSQAGQRVFASATPPARAKASKGKRSAAAPSARTAAGDLWAGFQPGERASVSTAEASAKSEGVGGTVAAALAVLGLGLAGMAGTMAAVGVRRRRARSSSR